MEASGRIHRPASTRNSRQIVNQPPESLSTKGPMNVVHDRLGNVYVNGGIDRASRVETWARVNGLTGGS